METKKEDLVMYILVNSEIGMKTGKIASQVAHSVQLLTEEMIRSAYEQIPVPEYYFRYAKWAKNPTKIVLKATTKQLLELSKMKEVRAIIDDGQTQVEPGSMTCVCFFPSNQYGELMKDFKLL